MSSSHASPAQPIPIPASTATSAQPDRPTSVSPHTVIRPTKINLDSPRDDIDGVEVPPAFLPRPRQNSEIHLDVFHHPYELHTPPVTKTEFQLPFQSDKEPSPPGSEGIAGMPPPSWHSSTSPPSRINTDSPSVAQASFENARSPVLAIHHSRGPVSPEELDDGAAFARTISGLSLNNAEIDPSPRRMSSVTSETTYVPMTPLPNNCTLSFLDRPREMANLIKKNQDLFTLIEHAVPAEKYADLVRLWKTPREQVPDEEWVAKTRSYIAIGPDEDEGGALWARWRELVGWDPDLSEEQEEEEYWNFVPTDRELHRRWSDFEKARNEEGAGSFGSGIGVTGVPGVGTGLSEIKEGEEEEFEDGERPVSMGGRGNGKS